MRLRLEQESDLQTYPVLVCLKMSKPGPRVATSSMMWEVGETNDVNCGQPKQEVLLVEDVDGRLPVVADLRPHSHCKVMTTYQTTSLTVRDCIRACI